MELHLAEIARTVAADAHALLILDGAGWHGAKDLKIPPDITLPKLPPCAPELNPMENVRQYLRANKPAITVFDGIAKLLAAACEALEKTGLCRHFGGVIGPEAERIAAGVAV